MTRRTWYVVGALVLLVLLLAVTWRRWMLAAVKRRHPGHIDDWTPNTVAEMGLTFGDLAGLYYAGHPSWYPETWQAVESGAIEQTAA